MKYLRTSDLAKAVGVHPNTVRRYVDRGLLPPVEHSPSGYRRFTQCLLIACVWLVRSMATNIRAKLSINREFVSSMPLSAVTWEMRWSLPMF
ncbi:MAG TPA: MerR family DNA-binding transcriptional regulator [Ktedonobacteraceae bacterium]